jgi:hypothetical protein
MGFATALVKDSVRHAFENLKAAYMRISAEPESVAFYQKLGFTFQGRQKSGCQLTFFKMGGPNISDAVYDITDPVFRSAALSGRKGSLVELFGDPTFVPKRAVVEEPAAEEAVPEEPAPVVRLTEINMEPKFHMEQAVTIHARTAEEFRAPPSSVSRDASLLHQIFALRLEETRKILGIKDVEEFELAVLSFLLWKYPMAGSAPSETAVPPPSSVSPKAPAPPRPAVLDLPRTEKTAKPAPEKKRPPPVPFMNPERKVRIDQFVASGSTAKAFNIRGTSGSGKTTIVKQLLAHPLVRLKEEIRDPDNPNRILLTILSVLTSPKEMPRDIAVLGSYHTPTGGCDTISGMGALDKIYGLVEEQMTVYGRHVVFEGLIVCSDFRRTVDMVTNKMPLQVILLNTSIENCKRNIDARRAQRQQPPLPDHANTVAKYEGNLSSIERFKAAGVHVLHLGFEEAFQVITDGVLRP